MRREAVRSSRAIEEDHLVPLELGGTRHDARSLWPEPRDLTPVIPVIIWVS
jgi:hypothetical protein